MDDTKPSAARNLEVESFLLRFPEQLRPTYRRLLYYAAMPLVLTPELLHYLRNAFVRESPWVAEADLLLAENLIEEKNFEQYVMATPVRALLLQEAAEQLGERNMQEAARLLVSYLYRHLPFSSLSPGEAAAQRWAALLYLDDYHDKVVAEIVQALHEALSASDAVSSYEGRAAFESMIEVINQIAPTLTDQPELVALARLTQSLLHEEIDPGSISQERLTQSPVVAGVQLPAIGRILRTIGAAPTLEWGPAAVPRDAGEGGADERPFQLRATLPSKLVVGVPAVLRVEVSSPEDAGAILLENGDATILESGDALLLEDDSVLGGVTSLGESEIEAGRESLSLEEAENELYRAVNFILPLKSLAEDVLEASVGATAVLAIRVTAPDFEIADDEQSLRVGADSGPTRVMYNFIPKQPGAARLLVECYAENLVVAALSMVCTVVTVEEAPAADGTEKKTILFVAANLKDSPPHRLDAEVSTIEDALSSAANRDRIELHYERVVRLSDLQRVIQRYQNNAVILHLMEIEVDGVIRMEQDDGRVRVVDTGTLSSLLLRFSNVQCVVLSSGYNDDLVNAVAEVVPYVIGIPSAMLDDAAIQFAAIFYEGVGAGLSIQRAFDAAADVFKAAGDFSDVRPVFIQGRATPISDASEIIELESSRLMLTGLQVEQICKGLLSAFPNHDLLAMMVWVELDISLDEIAGDENFQLQVLRLVQWAEKTGNVGELLKGASNQNPDNPELQMLLSSAASWPEVNEVVAPNLAQTAAATPPATQGTIDIVLIYSRQDAPIMRQLYVDLRRQGWTVWTDEGMESGTPGWQDATRDALRQASCLVVILSPNSGKSELIHGEVDYAVTLGRPIIPVLVAGDDLSAIPMNIINMQLVDLRSDYRQAVNDELLPMLRQHVSGHLPRASIIDDYMATFRAGPSNFDFMRNIADENSGRYIGEYGIFANEPTYTIVSNLDEVTSFDVVLVEHSAHSPKTQVRVLISEYAQIHGYNQTEPDLTIGDPPLIPKRGTHFQLVGYRLILDCKVMDAVYTKEGYFQSLTIHLQLMRITPTVWF